MITVLVCPAESKTWEERQVENLAAINKLLTNAIPDHLKPSSIALKDFAISPTHFMRVLFFGDRKKALKTEFKLNHKVSSEFAHLGEIYGPAVIFQTGVDSPLIDVGIKSQELPQMSRADKAQREEFSRIWTQKAKCIKLVVPSLQESL
jgi:hypothetical protein